MTDKKKLAQTPSQTVGPYFAYGLTPEQFGYGFTSIAIPDLLTPETEGQRIRLEGKVLDGQGAPVPDAMLEIWQADAKGRYAGKDGSNRPFAGFGRSGTASDGSFAFATIKPGPAASGEAPVIHLAVMMRGLLQHAFTRIYFEGEPGNAGDPVLNLVPPGRRATLIAQKTGAGVYTFDIHMQGAQETVFFDF